MPVSRIEYIKGGRVIKRAERYKNGKYRCHPDGQNKEEFWFSTLDEVAEFLRAHPGSGVRMKPGYGKISKHIYIDGIAR
jgi:hypothetical protein